MHPAKINNVINLNVEDRDWYSIREIVKLGKVWALSTPEYWITFVDHEGDEIFPIWPHEEVAEVCAFEELKVEGYSIQAIDYDKFKEFCIPEMVGDNILFGVFSDLKREAFVVDGERLLGDLEEED